MRLGVFRKEHISSEDPKLIGKAAHEQFQRTHAALQTWSSAEHKDDGAHGDVTADSLLVTGGAYVTNDFASGADLIARAGTGQESGIGFLQTVNGVPLVPGEPTRSGLLLGGVAAGYFLQVRPQAFAPFTSGSEIVLWNLAQTPLVRPIFRIGTMLGVPTLIDGGSGASLNIGDITEPIANVVATWIQGISGVRFSTGGASITPDPSNSALISNQHWTPNTADVVDLGLSGRRWRTLYAQNVIGSSVFLTGGITTFGRGVAEGVWADAGMESWRFTTWGGVAWTVPPASSSYRYMRVGKTVFIKFVWGNTTVAAGASIALLTQLPTGVTFPGGTLGSPLIIVPYALNAGVQTVPNCYIQALDANRWGCFLLAGWSPAAGNTTLYGSFSCEID